MAHESTIVLLETEIEQLEKGIAAKRQLLAKVAVSDDSVIHARLQVQEARMNDFKQSLDLLKGAR